MDHSKEFRNYLKEKNFKEQESLVLEDYQKIQFKTPNSLPEMINDISLYLFLKVPVVLKEKALEGLD